jgi:GT2 family glycosyltransferase/glycosyltransferase involved in cell wall biosynthesis
MKPIKSNSPSDAKDLRDNSSESDSSFYTEIAPPEIDPTKVVLDVSVGVDTASEVSPDSSLQVGLNDAADPVKEVETIPVKIGSTSAKLAGAFDLCGPIWFTGWIFDQSRPDTPLEICIFSDGNIVHQCVADNFRKDLLEADIGNGKHGFNIRIPEVLFDGLKHQIEIREVRTGFLLPNSPRAFLGELIVCQEIKLEGSALRGKFSVAKEFDSIDDIVVYENNQLIAKGETWLSDSSDGVKEFYVNLPLSVFDGRAHGFFLRSSNDAISVGHIELIMPYQLTPEDALLTYAREGMKSTVSNVSGFRYDSFTQSIDALTTFEPSKKLTTKHPLDLQAQIAQLSAVHKALVRGFHERDKSFAPLSFPTQQNPKVSIVIPVHNKFHVTYHCLASLILSPNNATFEVILVDDGSTDQTQAVQELIKGIQYVRNEESVGFIRACNKGALSAKGHYIVMLNNDTETTAGWLDELVGVFEHFDNVGMAGAKLLYPDGTLQEAGGIVWNSANPWNYGRQANPYDPKFCYARQTDYLSGACLMLPTALWKQIGGFSETYVPAYFEDTDLAFQVRELGYKTVYTPFAQVIHFEGISNGKSVESSTKRFQEINRPKFKARWGVACRNNGAECVDVELNKDRNVVFRALVLDAETPRPDLNAGSYAAIKEMEMLQALGFKCTFVPQNMAWMGKYTETLQRMGIECLYSPFGSNVNQIIEQRGQEFDLVYITRYYVARDYIDSIRQYAPNAKIVLMNADLHFLREIRAAIHINNDDDLNKAKRTREDELEVMTKVDLVLSYTDVEKAVIMSHNMGSTKVAKCPWVCDVTAEVKPFTSRVDIAFLGGFNHRPNIEAVEWFIQKVMPLLEPTLPEVRFRVYGSNVPQQLLDLAKKSKNVVIDGWVADVADVYNSCKVFLAPLQSGAGIKGKVIGALCYGLPCVLSTIAAEGISIGDGVHAAIANTPEQWATRITQLYTDEKLWSNMSANALAFATATYGMEKGVQDMQSALLEAGLFTTTENKTLVWH